MAITYGFYNSSGGDRKYNAEQISAVFNFLITPGVLSSYGEHFGVIPGTGRQVIVQSGWAWFDSTWTQNDSDLPLSIEPPDISVSRIDAVVIETNKNLDKRRNTIKIVQGTPSSNPQKPPLTQTTAMNEHAIAYVTVRPSATSIDLTDIEIVVGKDECPFCTSILQSTSISVLFNQWEGEFDAWFQHIQEVLSEEVVTNLYAEIDKRVKIADKATTSEAQSGTNDTHWMTPAKVKSAVEKRVNIQYGYGGLIPIADLLSQRALSLRMNGGFQTTNNGCVFISDYVSYSVGGNTITGIDSSGNWAKTKTNLLPTSSSVSTTVTFELDSIPGFEDILTGVIYSNKMCLFKQSGNKIISYVDTGTPRRYAFSSKSKNRLYTLYQNSSTVYLEVRNRTTLAVTTTYNRSISGYQWPPDFSTARRIDESGGLILPLYNSNMTQSTPVYWNPITGMNQTITGLPTNGANVLRKTFLYNDVWYLVWSNPNFSLPQTTGVVNHTATVTIQTMAVGAYTASTKKTFTIPYTWGPYPNGSVTWALLNDLTIDDESGTFVATVPEGNSLRGKVIYGSFVNASTSLILNSICIKPPIVSNNHKVFYVNNLLYIMSKLSSTGKVIIDMPTDFASIKYLSGSKYLLDNTDSVKMIDISAG